MRQLFLKLFVIFLLIFQGIVGFLSIYNYQAIFTGIKADDNLILSNNLFLILVSISLLISLFFVVIIFTRKLKTVTIIKEVQTYKPENQPKESRKKKNADSEQQLIQQQNERKKQIVNDIIRNLTDQMDLKNFSNQVLVNISKHYDIFQGIFFVRDITDRVFRTAGTYAYFTQEDLPEFSDGVGLTGQVASNKKLLNISNIPDKYITVMSGLGKSSPGNLLILPVINAGKTIGIIELASFIRIDNFGEQVLEESLQLIGQMLSDISKKAEKVQS